MHHVLTSFVWRCNIKETSAFFTWKRWEIGHFIGTQWLYIHFCGMLISETGTSINSPAWDRESQVVNSLCVTKRKLWCGKKKSLFDAICEGISSLCLCNNKLSATSPDMSEESPASSPACSSMLAKYSVGFHCQQTKSLSAVWRQTDTVHTFSSIHSWGKMQLVNLELAQLSHTVVRAVC